MNLKDLKGHTIKEIPEIYCGESGFRLITNRGIFDIEWNTYPDGSVSDYSIVEIKGEK